MFVAFAELMIVSQYCTKACLVMRLDILYNHMWCIATQLTWMPVYLQFSLLNGNLHDSYCQDLGASNDLTTEQLRRCEVLTYTSKVRIMPQQSK